MCDPLLHLVFPPLPPFSPSFPQELSPPLVEDFIYLCDDAYTHSELLKMETEVLHTLGYDINMPVAYRFLRRLARVRPCNYAELKCTGVITSG